MFARKLIYSGRKFLPTLIIPLLLCITIFWEYTKDEDRGLNPISHISGKMKRFDKQFKKGDTYVTMDSKIKSTRTIVIILAYMHTGSTFFGSILQNHKNTFYEYENLRSLMYSTRAGKEIHYLEGRTQSLRSHSDVNNIHHNIDPTKADAVQKMVTCNHQDLDIETLVNHYVNTISIVNRDVAAFFNCQEKLHGKSTRIKPPDAVKYVNNDMLNNLTRAKTIIRACLPLLKSKCEKSDIVIQKFIRMTMKMAQLLLKSIPNLKIIHLFRDPRAMLNSQVRKRDSKADNLKIFEGRAKYMCEQMMKDRKLARELANIYPEQIFTLRYEDLLNIHPKTIRKVFDFIDVPFTLADEQFVNETLKTSKPKLIMRLVFLSIVDKYCDPLYKDLGYK